MNRKIFFTILGLIILAVVLAIVARLTSPEDYWICQNSQWIKHGQPSAPQPTSECGEVKKEIQPTKSTIKLFFNNDRLDSETNCDQVFPVDRTVDVVGDVKLIALQELFKGPTDQEKSDHYFSSINANVKINSIDTKNGVVTADFSKDLEVGGGSCWVTSVRAEITKTLKQFPDVQDVVISVEGRVEDALQP